MAEGAPADDALLASLQRAGTAAGQLLRLRLQLLGLEVQEEKLRIVNWLVWVAVAMALAIVAVLTVLGIVGWFLWRQFGYAGIVGLALVSIASALALILWIRRGILAATPFSATTTEIAKDIASLGASE